MVKSDWTVENSDFTHLSAFFGVCVMSQCIGEFSSQNNSLYTWHNLIVGFKEFIL
jgi:hypothetical protein